MANVYEQNLPQKSTLTTSDFIRVVGSDNVSYKQTIPSIMNTMGVTRILISNNSDFNALVPNATLGTGYYRGDNVSTMANKPSPEVNAFPWALDAINVNGYVKQILHVYTAAGNIVTYERIQYYSSGSRLFAAWEKMPTRAEVDSLNSNFYSSGTINIPSFSVTLPSNFHAGIYAVNVNGSGNEVGWWQLSGNSVTLQPLSSPSRISASVSGTTITFTKTSGTSIRDIVLIIA